MKKLIVLLLTLCFILTGCGANGAANEPAEPAAEPATEPVSEPATEDPSAGLAFDCTEYSSLDEMNAAAGTNIQALGADESDETFAVISDSIAQYTFKLGEESWCVRASQDVDNDISGLYYDSINFEKDVTATYYNDEVYLLRFFNNDLQYTISVDVKDQDIARSYFDDISAQLQTNITGVKSGYEVDIKEDGNDVVYTATMYNSDGTTMIMQIIYTFDGDKMVSIVNNNIFETEQAAKEYYDELIASGYSADDLVLDGNVISADSNGNLEFYSDYTKAEFIEMMQDAIAQ